MNLFKTVFSICFQNIRKWGKDYRIWSVAVLVVVMINIYINDLQEICSKLSAPMPVWIFPFMYRQYYMKVIFAIPLILTFCNAPFIDSNQIYVYLRSGREKWLTGQILYIIVTAALYYLFIIIVTFILLLIHGAEFSLQWGKVLKTIAEVGFSEIGNYPFTSVSSMVIRCFTPIQAMWFTFLVSWSNAVSIGLLIFMFNYLLNNKVIGSLIASFDIVMSFFVDISGYSWLIKYSPTSWITLDKIDVGGMTEYPSFSYCMLVYWSVILITTAAIFIFGRKREIDAK